jgi:tetraacyldisaccharide 4'-kinase
LADRKGKEILTGRFKSWVTPLGVLASGIYGLGVFSRLALYRLGLLPVQRLPLSVISIGNLVVGGTGKTPHTALIADHFRRRGRKVVVLSRGYGGEKSAQGAVISSPDQIIGTIQEGGEEPYWLAEHLPGVAVVIGKNRYQAGLLSRERWGVELAILDDGFQHIGLEREVNILLIPAHQPFGAGGLLPRGTLREPRKQIKRADVVIISHTEMIAAREQSALEGQVKALHPQASVFFSRHVPQRVWKYPQGESRSLSWLKGRRVLGFCGLGQPESFRFSLETLAVELVGLKPFRDHQVYQEKDKRRLLEEAASLQAEVLMTTEKDALKLGNWPEGRAELLVLAIGVEIPDRFFWDVLESKIYPKNIEIFA